MCPSHSKDSLRRVIQDRRRARPDAQWAADDASRTRLLLTALGEVPGTVAMYASRPHEPGTHEAISHLRDAGWRILLPVLGTAPRWARFHGWEHMRPGWGGIPEPAVPTSTAELAEADVVVVACLAVATDGTRLGTGGGWYDRALPHRRPGAPVWALASSSELVDSLPREPHDVPVDRVLTELGSHVRDETTLPSISAARRGELS